MVYLQKYLLSIALGPVQDFVQAARRTRDLWFGSYLLSDVSKCVAASLVEDGATLIFPHKESLSGSQAVANKILAVFEGESVVRVLDRAHHAATTWLRETAQTAVQALQRELSSRRDVFDEALFFRQVDDFLEFYAAWVPMTDTYDRDRRRVEGILAARKMLRNFDPNEGARVPKSSLDGVRESVLRISTNDALIERALRRMGIRPGEALDAMGLIKRLSGQRPYPSVVRVAVDSWIQAGMSDERFRVQLGRVSETLERVLIEAPELDVVSSARGRDGSEVYVPDHYENFPYDGKALLEGFFEQEEFRQLQEQYPGLADELKRVVTRLREIRGCSPQPYLAVLMADGDRMGVQIDRMTTPDDHSNFSYRVSEFARRAQDVIVQHRGVPVYAGGDDVFAFLPIETCLRAADALRKLFEEKVASAVASDKPSLSVGIAIGYCREDLGYLRQLAQQAEHEAKEPDRNGLCVLVQTRSGGDPIRVRCRWDEDPVPRMERLAAWHQRSEIAHTTGYVLEQIGRLYGGAADEDIVAGELRRALSRRTVAGERRFADDVMDDITSLFRSRFLARQALQDGAATAALQDCASWLKFGHWLASHAEPEAWQNVEIRAGEEVDT